MSSSLFELYLASSIISHVGAGVEGMWGGERVQTGFMREPVAPAVLARLHDFGPDKRASRIGDLSRSSCHLCGTPALRVLYSSQQPPSTKDGPVRRTVGVWIGLARRAALLPYIYPAHSRVSLDCSGSEPRRSALVPVPAQIYAGPARRAALLPHIYPAHSRVSLDCSGSEPRRSALVPVPAQIYAGPARRAALPLHTALDHGGRIPFC